MALRKWHGEALKRRMKTSAIMGVNGTMAQSVGHAKLNHDWQNQTGTLERGTRIVQPAAPRGRFVSGLWGAANVLYARYLERNVKWAWLTPAAREIYPRLAANIKLAFSSDHRSSGSRRLK